MAQNEVTNIRIDLLCTVWKCNESGKCNNRTTDTVPIIEGYFWKYQRYGHGWAKTTIQRYGNMYGLATILFVLVLLAGILMISGSMNSIIAQRTQFLECCVFHWIPSRQQIIRFVRLEALNWCKNRGTYWISFGTIISLDYLLPHFIMELVKFLQRRSFESAYWTYQLA